MNVALMIAGLAGSLFAEPRNEIALELRPAAAIPRNSESAYATRRDARIDFCYKLSNDKGHTWFDSDSRWCITQGVSGRLKTGVVETALSQPFSWARINLESKYEFRSADDGLAWSAHQPRPLKLPLSPASTKRLPESGDTIAFINDPSFPFDPGMHTPLDVALSEDSGLAWPTRRLMESDTRDSYHYISVRRLDDGALIACIAGDEVMAKLSSPPRIRRIEFGWFPHFSALAQIR